MENLNDGIRITSEDLEAVSLPEREQTLTPAVVDAGAGRSYGTIQEATDVTAGEQGGRGSILLQGWFYLGLAGMCGALLGWAICEPGFMDGEGHNRWGNFLMIPMLVMLMAIGFGIAESLVERSVKKGVIRVALAIPLGAMLGFVLDLVANVVFDILLQISAVMGAVSFRNPTFWLARAGAWAVLGIAGGLVYGIAGQSYKKGKFGILGGMLGAGIGGLVFDPISMATGEDASGWLSRAVGFAVFGLATGAVMGVVESALKDRWFHVTAGPLAGKQFILYKTETVIGSDQAADIYLFKDGSILPRHAVLQANGSRMTLRAEGAVFAGGVPVQQRVLLSGDLIQIGRYTFRYTEKTK